MERVRKADIELAKSEGNSSFKLKEYHKAIGFYEDALKKCVVYNK